MDGIPCTTTRPNPCCEKDACTSVASGHLTSVNKFSYGYFKMVGRIGHPLRAGADGSIPANLFSCWTITYTPGPPHNEIAMCWDHISTEIHMAYWNDTTMHRTISSRKFDMGA